MNANVLKKQEKIHSLFGALRALDDVEWVDSISDDHNPNVCPCCGGWQESQYPQFQNHVGHRDDCRLVKAKRDAFLMAVDIASDMPDGNLFINLATALHLSAPAPRFG